MPSSPRILRVRTRDVRFRNGPGAGTDAVHSTGVYGYAVCVLETEENDTNTVTAQQEIKTLVEPLDPSELVGGGSEEKKEKGTGANTDTNQNVDTSAPLCGVGLAFTLGAGNETVCRAIEALATEVLVGLDIDTIMAKYGLLSHRMADHPQWRWLGPHKGTVALALAAITNAAWDLWAKSKQMPLWCLLLSLSPQALLATLDLSFVEDVMPASEVLRLLDSAAQTRTRREHILKTGYPGYDTSGGWLQYTDEQIVQNSTAAVSKGFRAIKLKVGSSDPSRDIRRAVLVRRALGPDVHIMLDVNQQWSLSQCMQLWPQLQQIHPLWLEEPTQPDDVFAHQALMRAGIPVAVGEAIPNRVVFKNFMQAQALKYCQVDPTRTGGISECIVVALLSKKHGLTVVPHVGCMGQLSQHLVLFYHIALDLPCLFLEHIPHLRRCFVHPAAVQGGVYAVPQQPGASSDLVPAVRDFSLAGLFDTVTHAHVVADNIALVAGVGTAQGTTNTSSPTLKQRTPMPGRTQKKPMNAATTSSPTAEDMIIQFSAELQQHADAQRAAKL